MYKFNTPVCFIKNSLSEFIVRTEMCKFATFQVSTSCKDFVRNDKKRLLQVTKDAESKPRLIILVSLDAGCSLQLHAP